MKLQLVICYLKRLRFVENYANYLNSVSLNLLTEPVNLVMVNM